MTKFVHDKVSHKRPEANAFTPILADRLILTIADNRNISHILNQSMTSKHKQTGQ